MMKMTCALTFACGLMLGTSAFAAKETYSLDLKLSLDGKPVMASQVVTLEGENAVISRHSDGTVTFLEVVATPTVVKGTSAIQSDFVIGTISADGVRTVLGTPKITTNEKSIATVTIADDRGHQRLQLSVLAKHIDAVN